jgi:hypothetical protein
MLDDLFRTLPKGLLAFAALLVGFVLIMLNDPPKSSCDAQIEIFRTAQNNFLFKQTKNDIDRTPDIAEMTEACRSANAPGGCHELFSNLLEMTKDLQSIPNSCSSTAGKIDEVESALTGSLKLMVQLAWGDHPPIGYNQRQGWLNTSDVALYCALKERTVAIYGQETFGEIQEALMKDLPLANTMSRDQVWERTILSNRCDAYR